VVVRRRRKLQDRQHLQTSTLATHSYDHPDVPTPQSVHWRLQLPACQRLQLPACQPGLLGNLDVVQPKGSSQFPLSPLECRHQPTPGLREFWPGQPTARQTCPRKVPAVTTSALPHNATKIRGPYPQRSGEALELSQGRLEALLPSHR